MSIDEYKGKYEALVLERNQMELEFGQKRAQFRQLYLEVEGKIIIIILLFERTGQFKGELR